MKAKKAERKKQVKAESVTQVRATLSFPPDVYETLKAIAKQKKVSLAWVVREAAEQYLTEKWPLFGKQA
jgi:predicted DNA-binding protein